MSYGSIPFTFATARAGGSSIRPNRTDGEKTAIDCDFRGVGREAQWYR